MKRAFAFLLTLVLLIGTAVVPVQADNITSTPIAYYDNAYFNNIDLACSAINGVYVASGASFSFNDVVGPRSKEAGYQTATNGRGADVRGGGVSQVAATLYLALLDYCNVGFGDLSFYGKKFTAGYCHPDDAVITDYKNGHDLYFRNYGDAFTIYMGYDNTNVYCEIVYGSSTGGYDDYNDYYDEDIYVGMNENYVSPYETSRGSDGDRYFWRHDTNSLNTIVEGYDTDGYYYCYSPSVFDGYIDTSVSSYLRSNSGGAVDGTRALDGDTRTAWNTDGWHGEEYIHLFPDDPGMEYYIVGFRIVNGYAKNEDIWRANSRVKTLEVWTGDYCLGSLKLEDTNEPQVFYFSDPGNCQAYSFYVKDVYKGYAYDDLCISEIELLLGKNIYS